MKPVRYLRVPLFAAISLPVLIALAASLITLQVGRGMATAPEQSSRAPVSQAPEQTVREILYKKCDHTLPAEGVANEQTAPGGVLVVDDYCPNHYVVKSGADGKIEVYRLANPGGEPVMTLDVNTSWLPEADRQALEQGIRIDSEHDLLALIEDYTS